MHSHMGICQEKFWRALCGNRALPGNGSRNVSASEGDCYTGQVMIVSARGNDLSWNRGAAIFGTGGTRVSVTVSESQGEAPGFSRLIAVDDPFPPAGSVASGYERQLCALLEAGHILFLPLSPISIPAEDRELLLGRKQTSSAYHKNIAYRPAEDRVTGLDASEQKEAAELRRLLSDYSRRATEFLDRFLAPYAGKRKLDYASFRPIEEKGRAARLHARNDLLHFDSFPTRPTNGARILRLFTNINPAQNRVWLTSQTFEAFGPRMAKASGLLSSFTSAPLRGIRALARTLHLPG